ncbi:MAG: hypothetical protein AAGF11_27790 [Myxococcota bacterium]
MRRLWVAPRVDDLLGALERHHTARLVALGPARSRVLLTAAVQTARRYDLAAPAALKAYATLVIAIDDDLGHPDLLRWSGPVLDDPWLNPEEKLAQLEQLAVEHGRLTP